MDKTLESLSYAHRVTSPVRAFFTWHHSVATSVAAYSSASGATTYSAVVIAVDPKARLLIKTILVFTKKRLSGPLNPLWHD
jgi:hypothetical protein